MNQSINQSINHDILPQCQPSTKRINRRQEKIHRRNFAQATLESHRISDCCALYESKYNIVGFASSRGAEKNEGSVLIC